MGMRTRTSFDFDWRFARGDPAGAQRNGFDDRRWRRIDLPHDWCIEQRPDAKTPGGGSNGWLQGGIGWYRKAFTLSPADRGRTCWIEFDGVYHNSDVWINGHHLGHRGACRQFR
jgi:beta-galactosidase